MILTQLAGWSEGFRLQRLGFSDRILCCNASSVLLVFFQFGQVKGRLIGRHLAYLAEGFVGVLDLNDIVFDW